MITNPYLGLLQVDIPGGVAHSFADNIVVDHNTVTNLWINMFLRLKLWDSSDMRSFVEGFQTFRFYCIHYNVNQHRNIYLQCFSLTDLITAK